LSSPRGRRSETDAEALSSSIGVNIIAEVEREEDEPRSRSRESVDGSVVLMVIGGLVVPDTIRNGEGMIRLRYSTVQ
jgi:hypothetical protein